MRLANMELYEDYIFSCNRCRTCTLTDDPRCLPICPSYERYGFFTYCGGGKAHIAQKLVEGSRRLGPDLAEALYRCNLCRACQAGCIVTIDTYSLILDLREAMVKRGFGPLPGQRPLLDGMREQGNPYGTREGRGRWAEGIAGLKDARSERAEVLFLAGCAADFEPSAGRGTANAARALLRAEVDLVTLGGAEPCCGAAALELGDAALFESMARQAIGLFRESGAEKIVVSCPKCFHHIRETYPEVDEDFDISVRHVTELLADLVKAGTLSPSRPVEGKVTYHDPCHLGRYAEVYEAPRALLAAIPGLELVEMERIRDKAYCCGSGTGIRESVPDLASFAAAGRLAEARTTGASVLATACSHCETHLGESLADGGEGRGMEIADVATLLLRALE